MCSSSFYRLDIIDIIVFICAHMLHHSVVSSCLRLMDYQAPLSMGFSWQEYWSGLPFPSLSVAQSCPTLFDPMNCSTPGLPVLHQLQEPTQTIVH